MGPTKGELLERARGLGIDGLTEASTIAVISAAIADRAVEEENARLAAAREAPSDAHDHAYGAPELSTAVPDDARELVEQETRTVDLPAGLRLRQPTGRAAFPVVLVEGEEKGGKTYLLAQLSASPRVGATFAFDLAGDGTLDEYAPLGPYRIVETNGTFGDFYQQLKLAASVPPADPDRPNVLGVDSMTSLWSLICDWLDGRARGREKNRKILERDPDAEIQITNDLWNEGKERWRAVMNVLMAYPGIVVVTARGKEVAVVDDNGAPTRQKTWKVEAEKTLTWDASAWVRVERGVPPRLNAVRSLSVDLPTEGMALPRANTIEYLVFDVLGAGVEFGTRSSAAPEVGIHSTDAKKRLLAFVLAQPNMTEDLAKQRASHVWRRAGLQDRAEVTNADFAEVLRLVAAEAEGSQVGKAEPEAATVPDAARGSAAAEDPTGTEPVGPPAAVCIGCGGAIEDEADEVRTDSGLYHAAHVPDGEGPVL